MRKQPDVGTAQPSPSEDAGKLSEEEQYHGGKMKREVGTKLWDYASALFM